MKSNTQNAKIEAITEKTLVLGIDVGSETHVKPSLKKFAFLIFVSGSLSSRDFRSSVILLNHTLALFS